MNNFVNEANLIDFPNSTGADITYHQVVPITGRIGIAADIIPIGAVGSLSVSGAWELPAETGVAFAVGDPLYWDNTNKRLTKTASGNTPAGWCIAAKASAAAIASTKIN